MWLLQGTKSYRWWGKWNSASLPDRSLHIDIGRNFRKVGNAKSMAWSESIRATNACIFFSTLSFVLDSPTRSLLPLAIESYNSACAICKMGDWLYRPYCSDKCRQETIHNFGDGLCYQVGGGKSNQEKYSLSGRDLFIYENHDEVWASVGAGQWLRAALLQQCCSKHHVQTLDQASENHTL